MNTAATWLLNRAKQAGVRWLPLSVLTLLLLLVVLVLNAINTAGVPYPFLPVMLLSLIINSLLIKTRWSVWQIVSYNVLMAFFVSMQLVGMIFFSDPLPSFLDWLIESNLRLFIGLERLNDWTWYLLQGTRLQDVYGWPLFLCFQLWLLTGWLWFTYHRRVSVWWGGLIPAAWTAVWVQQEGLAVSFLMATLLCCFLLVSSSFYYRQQTYWEDHHLDYPAELWVEWAVSALLIIIVSLSVARAAPLVTTEEGWQRIHEWVDELRPRKEAVGVAGSPPGVNNALTHENAPTERDLQPPNVRLVGTPLEQSHEMVMQVGITGSFPFHWRSEIYSAYTGQGWEEAPLESDTLLPSEAPPGRIPLSQTFTLSGGYQGRLFAAGDPFIVLEEGVSIAAVDETTGRIQDGASFILLGDSRHYQVTAWVPDLTRLPDFSAPPPLPQAISAAYLQLPPALPPRVGHLAESIIQDTHDPFRAALRVQQYVRAAVPYDLNTPLPPAGRDVVDYFLFDAPSGFCSYYASAMAVLLRSQGIPARVVTGYASGAFDPESQLYQVAASSAHAWVEVYFAGYGWLPFEPTPSQPVPDYAAAADQTLPSEQELTPQQWLTRRRWVSAIIGLLAVGVIGLGAWGTLRIRERRNQYMPAGSHPAVWMYGQIRFRLHLAGGDLPVWLTAREFLRANQPLAENYHRLWNSLVYATSLFERSVYSPDPPTPHELRRLQKLMRRGLGDWRRLMLRRVWQLGSQKLTRRWKKQSERYP